MAAPSLTEIIVETMLREVEAGLEALASDTTSLEKS